MSAITSFKGRYHGFLSNFHPCIIVHHGLQYPTVEHAFQAAKTTNGDMAMRIRDASTPGKAKALGRKCKLRDDWDLIKRDLMSKLLWQKFSYAPLRSMLLETGDRQLIEGNDWFDHYWGVCNKCMRGSNYLGRLLMSIRCALQEIYEDEELIKDCRRKGPCIDKPIQEPLPFVHG